jgi:hypothetical protein
MPKLEIKISHSLSQSDALIRIQNILPQLKAQHSDKISTSRKTGQETLVLLNSNCPGLKSAVLLLWITQL